MPAFNLYKDLKKLGERYAGAYLVNKFFIRICTGRQTSAIPDYDYENRGLTIEAQLELQKENFETLFHEYIHYVHEVSTMAGITQFYLELVNLKIFAHFVDLPISSQSRPVTGKPLLIYNQIRSTIDAIQGGSLVDLAGQHIYQIDQVVINPFPARNPFADELVTIGVPVVYYKYGDISGSDKLGWVYFGKYFLYEGLAHHLDQLVGLQRGKERTPENRVAPEYKMMNWVSQRLCPGIDERSMLEMASLSLSYPDCGGRFVKMLEEAATVPYLPGFVMELYNEAFTHLQEHQQKVQGLLNQIKDIFKRRAPLAAAATHLCDEMKKAYEQRMAHPVFELDVTFQRRPEELAQYVVACDMVYEFEDDDEYLRDFAGTYLTSNQLAGDLKTFLCHVDFYETSIKGPKDHCCPLFHFCPHQLRQDKPGQCRTQPHLAFEDQPAYGWCHYSFGVAYMKGTDQFT